MFLRVLNSQWGRALDAIIRLKFNILITLFMDGLSCSACNWSRKICSHAGISWLVRIFCYAKNFLQAIALQSWTKTHLWYKILFQYLSKNVKYSIGILSRLKHCVASKVLIQLYYSLIYLYLIYSIPVWGNIYFTFLKPLLTLQKKAVGIVSFTH